MEIIDNVPEKSNRTNVVVIILIIVLAVMCCCCLALIGSANWLWVNGDRIIQELQNTGMLLLPYLA
mgnify:CR=1 FL=1